MNIDSNLTVTAIDERDTVYTIDYIWGYHVHLYTIYDTIYIVFSIDRPGNDFGSDGCRFESGRGRYFWKFPGEQDSIQKASVRDLIPYPTQYFMIIYDCIVPQGSP